MSAEDSVAEADGSAPADLLGTIEKVVQAEVSAAPQIDPLTEESAYLEKQLKTLKLRELSDKLEARRRFVRWSARLMA